MLVSVSHSPLSALLFNILSPSLNLHTENWLIRTVYAAASQNSMLFSPSFSAVCVPCQKVQSTACHAFRCTLTHTHSQTTFCVAAAHVLAVWSDSVTKLFFCEKKTLDQTHPLTIAFCIVLAPAHTYTNTAMQFSENM